MATAQQKASPGVYITNDVGLEVTDGADSRVQLGLLPNGQYGVRIVSAGGGIVIVDGTSDMFKILATGTLSAVWSGAANTNVAASATIVGSGSAVLASLWLLTPDNTAGLTRTPMTYIAPNGTGNVLAVLAGVTDINAGDNRMTLNATNYAGAPFSGKTAAGRFYLLQETGI